jgi:hypothetical protein
MPTTPTVSAFVAAAVAGAGSVGEIVAAGVLI